MNGSEGFLSGGIKGADGKAVVKKTEVPRVKREKPDSEMMRMLIKNSYNAFESVAGTVKAKDDFNPQADCELFKSHLNKRGYPELCDLLVTRSTEQRLDIGKAYKTMWGESIQAAIRAAFSGDTRVLVEGLFINTIDYDCNALRQAMKGLGTDERTIIDVLAPANNADIRKMRMRYKEKFDRDLEKDLVGETSGDFKRLIVSLLQGNRDECEVDPAKAAEDARRLYDAGEKVLGTDESIFNAIMATRSYDHLRAVFTQYSHISQTDIRRVVASEFSGDIADLHLGLVDCSQNIPGFQADVLNRAISGLGTDDDSMIRIIVTRSEIDMEQVKLEYEKRYKQTLAEAIKGDTSGDYRLLLLCLIGEKDQHKK